MASATTPATNGTSAPTPDSTDIQLGPGPVGPLTTSLLKAENNHDIDTGTNRFVFEVKKKDGSVLPEDGIYWQVDEHYVIPTFTRYTYAPVLGVNPAVPDADFTLLGLTPPPQGSAEASKNLLQFLNSLGSFEVVSVEQNHSEFGRVAIRWRVTIRLDQVLWQVVTGWGAPIVIPKGSTPVIFSINKVPEFVPDPKDFPTVVKPSDAAIAVAAAECAIKNEVKASPAQASA